MRRDDRERDTEREERGREMEGGGYGNHLTVLAVCVWMTNLCPG